MTLKEMKKKVLTMIEELNPDSEYLTDDPDIQLKFNDIVNQIMFEVIRIKKLPMYVEMEVSKGDILKFEDIEKASKYSIYQLGNVSGIECEIKAQGTIVKVLESGTAEIDFYRYPEAITSNTKDSYEFDIPSDLLEIMPYGIAGDALKSDISSDYGAIYSNRYEMMLQRLDPRYSTELFTVDNSNAI